MTHDASIGFIGRRQNLRMVHRQFTGLDGFANQ
jgi:hypothetical protein